MNCPVVYDDQCNATRMYLLNTDFLFLRPAKGRELKPLGDRAPYARPKREDATLLQTASPSRTDQDARRVWSVDQTEQHAARFFDD